MIKRKAAAIILSATNVANCRVWSSRKKSALIFLAGRIIERNFAHFVSMFCVSATALRKMFFTHLGDYLALFLISFAISALSRFACIIVHSLGPSTQDHGQGWQERWSVPVSSHFSAETL